MPENPKPLVIAGDGPLERAADVIRSGGIAAYPTETFYGLGVDPFNDRAVRRLFLLKGRSPDKPVPLVVKNRAMLEMVAARIPPLAERLIKKFWPGPLTIIFEAKKNLPEIVTAGTGRVGVRISSAGVVERLFAVLEVPLTATSANPSSKKPAVSAPEVMDYFNGRLDLVIDGGGTPGGMGSTIVDVTGGEIVLVREGVIPFSEIRAG